MSENIWHLISNRLFITDIYDVYMEAGVRQIADVRALPNK